MKTSNIISLLIAAGSLAVSIFVYLQTRELFELKSKPFIYVDETLENERLSISLQNVVGSDILLVEQVQVGKWDLFQETRNDQYNFFPNPKIKDRPIGPGESIDLLGLEVKDQQQLHNLPDKMPLLIRYRDRSENTMEKEDEISLYILKNTLENKKIRMQLDTVRNDFKILLERNQTLQIPDDVRRRLNRQISSPPFDFN